MHRKIKFLLPTECFLSGVYLFMENLQGIHLFILSQEETFSEILS